MSVDDDEMRFSDEQLRQLKQDFEEYKQVQDHRWLQLAEMVEQNTEATKRIAESTEAVVRIYQDVQGAARIGRGVGKFTAWLAGLGAAGAAVAAGVAWVVDKFSGP